MIRPSSTLETSQGLCIYCGKRLKETEYYYLRISCTECNHRHLLLMEIDHD